MQPSALRGRAQRLAAAAGPWHVPRCSRTAPAQHSVSPCRCQGTVPSGHGAGAALCPSLQRPMAAGRGQHIAHRRSQHGHGQPPLPTQPWLCHQEAAAALQAPVPVHVQAVAGQPVQPRVAFAGAVAWLCGGQPNPRTPCGCTKLAHVHMATATGGRLWRTVWCRVQLMIESVLTCARAREVRLSSNHHLFFVPPAPCRISVARTESHTRRFARLRLTCARRHVPFCLPCRRCGCGLVLVSRGCVL